MLVRITLKLFFKTAPEVSEVVWMPVEACDGNEESEMSTIPPGEEE